MHSAAQKGGLYNESTSCSTVLSIPPVALAILFRSSFLTRLTPIAFASTKYLRHKSSIPPDTRTTLAPADSIFSTLSFTISYSLQVQSYKYQTIVRSYRCLIPSSFSGSVTRTDTPICIFAFWSVKSRQAILALSTFIGIARGRQVIACV